MNVQQLAQLVKQMRYTQAEHRKRPCGYSWRQRKDMEARVDKAVAAILGANAFAAQDAEGYVLHERTG